MLHYKGYTGKVEIDIESGVLFGHILDIQDVVTFKGETVAKAKQAFEESIDDYFEFCESFGQEPNRPFSGKLPFR
jgi:predicted HicB family RNase H-like nuclease